MRASTEYLPDRIQPEGRPQPLRVGPVRKDEQQDARQNRIDDQRVQTGAAQRRYDRNRSASDLNDQIPHSQERFALCSRAFGTILTEANSRLTDSH